MKKLISYFAILAAAATLFACGGQGVAPVDTSKDPDIWKPVGPGEEEKPVEPVKPGETYYPKGLL